ncbi:hypothetical protein SAMN02744102_04087 [Paenibacillus barengoltzii]|jgi:hypothetical protein|nr:hypothetical protein SAMN02744102_04087 [Paenibacillus barengoltzii]
MEQGDILPNHGAMYEERKKSELINMIQMPI